MAYRTWGRVLLAALLVGIVSGAGQLGIAYGLGLVRFDRGFDAATVNQWPAQLVWVGWFAMVAAVLGAMLADRLARRYTLPTALGNRAAISALAALGALAVAPLSMQPARAAQVASGDPVTLAGVAAAIGAGVGFLAALAALSQRPVVWNIAAVTGAVWLLAVLSVLPSLGPTDPLPAVRLGGVDPSWLSAGTSQRLAVVTMPALALVAGALTGALARWREQPVSVVASCGVAGPLMLALAYVVAGRGDSADAYQAAPYWGALISVGAGALGSVLAAWARWPLTTTAPEETAAAGSTAAADPSAAAMTPGGADGATSGDTGTTPAGSGASDAPTVIIPAANPAAGGTTAGGVTTGTAASGGTTTGGVTTGTAASGGTSAGGTTAGGTSAGGTSADRTWRLEVPSGDPRTGGTGTGGDRVTGTTPAGTWPPSSAIGGRTVSESTEPSREPAPSSGNWSFDIGRGIPTPRVPTEDSAPTERLGALAPTVPDSGQQSATEPISPGSGGPASDSGDAGFPAGWAGARRLRTEDFWPTTTPSTTPAAPAAPAATTQAAPEPLAAPPPTVPPPPTVSTPSAVPAPPAATSTPPTATSNRSDDAWDAFTSVSRARLDRREPSTDPAHRPADSGAAGTTSLSGSGSSSSRATPERDAVGPVGTATGLTETGRSRTEPSGADPTRTERIPPIPVVSGDTPVQPTPDRGTRPADPGPKTTAEVTSKTGTETETETGTGTEAGTGTGTGTEAGTETGTEAGTGTGTETEAGTADPERPTGRIRRGLFRRNRGGADPERTDTVETGKGESKQDKGESKQREAKGRNRTEEPVPARDEEYVDWVSGLSEPDPTADDLGLDRSVRRSLRSTGRHHAD